MVASGGGSPDGGRCPARPAVPPARGRGLPSPAGTGCGARGAGWPPSTVGRSWPRRSGVETPCDSPRGSEPAQHSQPARQAGARCSVGAGSGEQRPGRVFASPCAGLWGRGRGQAGRGGLSTCSGCTAAAGVVACVTPPTTTHAGALLRLLLRPAVGTPGPADPALCRCQRWTAQDKQGPGRQSPLTLQGRSWPLPVAVCPQ